MKKDASMKMGGFTLFETLFAAGLSVLVMAMLFEAFIVCNRNWHRTALDLASTREGSQCLERMVYGVGTGLGLRAAYWVTNWGSTTNWQLQSSNYYGYSWYRFNPANQVVVFSNARGISVIGSNVVSSLVSNTPMGISVSLTLVQAEGGFRETNSLSTYIKMRTPKTF